VAEAEVVEVAGAACGAVDAGGSRVVFTTLLEADTPGVVAETGCGIAGAGKGGGLV
jgi:hypothetical protein